MSSTQRLIPGFGADATAPFAMTIDRWLVVGPIALALALAGMLIWFAG